MSYIAFDLDALNRAPAVARASGLEEEQVIAGLVRLWAWCFREKTDRITKLQVVGHFGADACEALVAFSFLEASDEAFRVRGADRYLRVNDGRRKGGLAASKNLIPGGPKKKRQPRGGAETQAESQPRVSRESAEEDARLDLGLSPNTEHRAPNIKTLAPASRAPRESDTLLEDFLAVTGTRYLWQGAKDGNAFAELRRAASLDEVRARWRRGLQAPADDWLSCRTVAQLKAKWNDLAAKPTQRVSIEHQPSRML